MARNWLQIEVLLTGGRGTPLEPPPGRILVAGGSHTFADLARGIDLAFARWDLGHLHAFELPGGRLIGPLDANGDDDGWLDEETLLVADGIGPGDELTYVFDFGDEWRHECRVAADLLDPREELGEVPVRPAPIWGWGTIPDQHGRTRPDDE